MKIALVTHSFLPQVGGGEYVVHYLANTWSSQGHEVQVLNATSRAPTHPAAKYTARKYLVARGATRFGYHRFPWRQISCFTLGRHLRKFAPDVISAHFGLPVAFFMSSIQPRCPWSITCHGGEISPAVCSLSERCRYDVDTELGRSLNAATAIIAMSGIAEASVKELGARQEKIRRIPNGVDTAMFRKEENFSRLMRIGLTGAPFLLSVGRNSPQKNMALGLRAFASIAHKYPDLHYLIAGRDCGLLNDWVMKFDLAGRVTLSEGLRGEDLVAAYQRAIALVSPSVYEFSSLVVLEAMAAGLPQVATNVPGTRDFVFDGETGLLADRDDPGSLALAMERLLGSADFRKQMKVNCIRRSRQYDWSIIANAYLAALMPDGDMDRFPRWQWKQ